jgi:hypothetical protein
MQDTKAPVWTILSWKVWVENEWDKYGITGRSLDKRKIRHGSKQLVQVPNKEK